MFMKAFPKAILFLGIAVMLLGVSLGAAAEDDDVQTPVCATLTTVGAGNAARVRGAEQARAELPGTVVVSPGPARITDRVSNFVFHDSRSTLGFLCLLLY
jgi:hypothetical protein